MEAIPANVKMIANTHWLEENGITVPFGAMTPLQFLRSLDSQGSREYFEKLDELFCGGSINDGAEKIANYMIEVVNSRANSTANV